MLLDFKTQVEASVAEAVQKAMPAVRGEGAGRKGGVSAPDDLSIAARDADPLRYIARKATSGQALDEIDQTLINALTFKALTDGLTMSEDEDDNGLEELQSYSQR